MILCRIPTCFEPAPIIGNQAPAVADMHPRHGVVDVAICCNRETEQCRLSSGERRGAREQHCAVPDRIVALSRLRRCATEFYAQRTADADLQASLAAVCRTRRLRRLARRTLPRRHCQARGDRARSAANRAQFWRGETVAGKDRREYRFHRFTIDL